MADAISPIDSSQIPADVRKDGVKGEQLYATALQFESVLTEQLAQSIAPSQADKSSDDQSSGDDGTTSLFTQMLPQAFTKGITGAGGLGLAHDLYEALKSS
jgi:Rod binding domain-containing protein